MYTQNSSKKLEICCYSTLSCISAENGGADRIELCGGRPEGGVTPSYGVLKTSIEVVKIPIYVMIRPRGGDFLFNSYERKSMLVDIENLKSLKPGGFVIGALKANGDFDYQVLEEQIAAIGDYPITVHRAFDMCKNPESTIPELIDLGIQNILTSGSYQYAIDGFENLKKFREIADGKINIMAGSGVNPSNILKLSEANVDAYHFTAKKPFDSLMDFRNDKINMGGNKSVNEFANYEADEDLVRQARNIIETL